MTTPPRPDVPPRIARALRVELTLLDGVPRATIIGEGGVRTETRGARSIALLWYLRTGKPVARRAAAWDHYRDRKTRTVSDLFDRLADGHGVRFEGLIEKTPTHFRLCVDVTTDRMRMADDIAAGHIEEALGRYIESPLDSMRRTTGRPSGTEAYEALEQHFAAMAEDGLAGLFEAATARLATLEHGGSIEQLDVLERQLLKCAEDAVEAEPLFGRIRTLRERPLPSPSTPPVTRATLPAALDVTPPVTTDALRPTSRRMPRPAAFAGLAITLLVLVSSAVRMSTASANAPTAPVARFGVLDENGGIHAFTLRRDSAGRLSAARLDTAFDPRFIQQLHAATTLNGFATDPVDGAVVVPTHGERGVDIARLSGDGTLTSVVSAAEDDYGPVFSPNGRWMAFSSARGSTSASYDVDLWLRDRWTGREWRVAQRRHTFEHALRFDATSSVVWVSTFDKAAHASALCRVVIATNSWTCRTTVPEVAAMLRVNGDTLVVLAGSPDPQLATVEWTRDGIVTLARHGVNGNRCAFDDTGQVGVCISPHGSVTVVDAGNPRATAIDIDVGSAAVRPLVFHDARAQLVRPAPADLMAFGSVHPALQRDSSGGVAIALPAVEQWQNGVFVRSLFTPDRPVVVSGEIQVPLTRSRWQAARIWIVHPDKAISGAANGDADGFTRDGIWDNPVCSLALPNPIEPQQPGAASVAAGAKQRLLIDPSIGGAHTVPFSLEYDGEATCIATVGTHVVSIPARHRPGLPLAAAVTGRAVGTRGVVSELVVRGTFARAPH